jgi:N6-adenosine-specific RNA methylase IME4
MTILGPPSLVPSISPGTMVSRRGVMQPATEIELKLCYPNRKAREVDAKAVLQLAASIAECGLLTPITVRKVQKSRAGQTADAYEVIAGMHRVKAFRRLQRETIPAIVLDVDDLHAELMLIDENLCRNDLTAAERASAQARRKAIYQQLHPETKAGQAQAAGMNKALGRHGQPGHDDEPAPRFDEAAAEASGQSERTVRRDVTRGETLGEATLAKVARTALDKGEELDALAKLPTDRREALIERAMQGGKVSAKIELKKANRESKEKDLADRILALPDIKAGLIISDFEWDFEPYSRETGMDRHASNHYVTAKDSHAPEQIVERQRERMSIAADNCIHLMWVPACFAAIGHKVMELQGYTYVSQFVWIKPGMGTGYWVRDCHELLFIGVKGKVPAPSMGEQFRSAIEAPKGAHSQKPDFQYEIAEKYFPNLPKVELNARRARPGWIAWGNEAPLPAGDADVGSANKPIPVHVTDYPEFPSFLKRDADNAAPFRQPLERHLLQIVADGV